MTIRRKWWPWACGIGLAWVAAALVWKRVLERGGSLWMEADGPWDPVVMGVWVLPVILVALPATLGPLLLASDLRTARLEPLILTPMGRRPFLAAYRRRVLLTAGLLLAAFVPFWAPAGRGPAPLYLMPDMLDALAGRNGEGRLWWAAQISLSGSMSDIASIWLAASLGLAAATLTRRFAAALAVSLAASGVFVLLSWGAAATWAGLLDRSGMPWLMANPPWICIVVAEPGFTTLCWGFALGYMLAAVATSEMAMRLAARRLDWLISE